MKYLKLFEDLEKYPSKCYWLLPTDNRMEDAFKKINCKSSFAKNMLDSNSIRKMYKYIFIGKYGAYWGWNPFKEKLLCDSYEEMNYTFMGAVDIEEIEFELDTTKYNL